MDNRTFTTVKEMTDKVNEMLELIEKSKTLAKELLSANVRNEFTFRYAPNSVDEVRPAKYNNMEYRIKEAQKYQKLFESLRSTFTKAEMLLAREY